VRHFRPGVRYCGDFYGQDGEGTAYPDLVGAEALVRLLERLGPGVTELGCHPGYDAGLDTMYVRERSAEVEALCDPRVRAAAGRLGIELVSFRELGGGGGRAGRRWGRGGSGLGGWGGRAGAPRAPGGARARCGAPRAGETGA